MAKFIPQYRTPEEQGRLEDLFFTFVKYVSLEAEQDYRVKVSEREGVVYLLPMDTCSYLKNGAVSVFSRGENVNSIDKIKRQVHHGCVELSHDKEVIINGEKFVLANYSRLLA